MLKNLYADFRFYVSCRPALLPLYRPFIIRDQREHVRRGGKDVRQLMVDQETEAVLDGFPSSANSFAARAFLESQPGVVNLGNHLHSSAQILRGVQLGKPVLFVIRNPTDTVISGARRWPHQGIKRTLNRYIDYHRRLVDVAPEMVVSDFPVTTKHLGTAIAALNERFGTEFCAEIDPSQLEKYRSPFDYNDPDWEEKKKKRKELDEQTKATLAGSAHEAAFSRAEEIYQALTNSPHSVRLS